MFRRTLDLKYDQLVIGSDLSALSYAYINKAHVLYTYLNKPYRFNKDNDWEIQRDTWNDLAFLLAYSSYMPFSNNVASIRIEEGNILKVVTKNDLLVNIKYNKLIISDDSRVEGLPSPNKKTSYDNWVIDYFDYSSGTINEELIFTSDDNFVKRFQFYPSERKAFHPLHDIVAISIINDKDLYYSDHSQNIARIKILTTLEKTGILGKKNGFYNGRQRFRPLKITHNRRLIYPLGKNLYKQLPKNVSILYDDYKTILSGTEIKEERIETIKRLYGISR